MINVRNLYALLLLTISFSAFSAEWFSEPSISLVTQYDDNFYLRTQNEIDTSSFIVDPKLSIQGKDERWNLIFDTRFRAIKYNDIEDSDTNSLFLNFNNSYLLENGQLGLALNFDKNTTFDRDYDTQLPQSGLVELQIERETLFISPYWESQLTENVKASVNYKATDITYSDNAPSNYNDYNSQEVNLGLTWDQTEKDSLGLNLSNTQTKVDDRDYESEENTLLLSYDYGYSENVDFNVTAGKTRIKYVYSNYPVCTGYLDPFLGCIFGAFILVDNSGERTIDEYKITYDYKHDISDININVNRTTSYSSSGSVTQSDKMSYSYHRKISERLGAGVIISRDETESLDGLDTSQDRELTRFQPSIVWKLSEYWALSFRYRYTKQILTGSAAESDSNSVYAALSMKWPKLISLN